MRKVLLSVFSVLLLASLVGCQESDSDDSSGDSSSDSAEQQQALEEAQRELTRAEQEAEEAREEAEAAREEAEATSQEQDEETGGGSENQPNSGSAASEGEESAGLSPVETLDLQYQFLNSGQYEKAYNLFAEESQRLISLEQYSNAYASTYEVSDYTVYSEQTQGNTATLEARLFVSGTQRGSHNYPVTQEFVQEDGEWRVIMRDTQVEVIANKTSGEDDSGDSQESASNESSEQNTIPGDGTFLVGEDIQPGTYETEGGGSCYWERLSGTSGTMNDVITNGLPTGPATITISPSDEAFLTEGCSEWTLR